MGAKVDIWRAANVLVNQHGEDAAIIAAQRADALLAEGDVEGQRVFKEIVEAITPAMCYPSCRSMVIEGMSGEMSKTKDELDGLRQFLAELESPDTFCRKNGVDIKDREIQVLKREIAHLESVLARVKGGNA